jgi:hypothetical protein
MREAGGDAGDRIRDRDRWRAGVPIGPQAETDGSAEAGQMQEAQRHSRDRRNAKASDSQGLAGGEDDIGDID